MLNRYLTPREALFIIIVRHYNARTCAGIFRLPAFEFPPSTRRASAVLIGKSILFFISIYLRAFVDRSVNVFHVSWVF